MGNMSYCRHQNTLADLQDVWDNWYRFDKDDASDREVRCRQRLIELILEMAEELEESE